METKVKKKSSFFRKLIIALITLSKAYKLKLISEEKMEKESKIIMNVWNNQHNLPKNFKKILQKETSKED